MEGAEVMTNEQMWTMYDTILTIIKMAGSKEDAIAAIEKIIESNRTNQPNSASQPKGQTKP